MSNRDNLFDKNRDSDEDKGALGSDVYETMKASEAEFEEWSNEEDSIYDDL